MKPTGAGKGDAYRKVDRSRWGRNYERIFGAKKKATTTKGKRIERPKESL
jgi:hypothetical protein